MKETFSNSRGEIVWSGDVSPGDKISVQKKTREQQSYAIKYEKDWLKDLQFGKIYVEMMEYINKEITPTVWMFFCRLMKFTCYKDCALRIGGRPNGKALSSYQEIADSLNESYKYVYRNMTTLIGQQLIIVATTGCEENNNSITVYLMNPYLFFRGRDIQRSVIKEFQDCKWAKYNKLITEYNGNVTSLLDSIIIC